MSKFSEDCFFEILSWLPVSSLLRFRCVCKCWFNLISQNPSFVKLHLVRANATQIDNPMFIFIPDHSGTLRSFNYVDHLTSFSPVVHEKLMTDSPTLNKIHFVDIPSSICPHVEYVMKHPETLNQFYFMASCNGLICITNFTSYEASTAIYLWNPATGEIKVLPKTPYKHPARRSYRVIASGFGCNHTLDDYKVIRILQYVENEKDHHLHPVWDDDKEENFYFDVYTLGTNSWKRIRDMPCKFSRRMGDSTGLHINGGLHWIGSVSPTESNIDGIISFDIEDEEYREVPKPDCFDVMTNAWLQVLGGCLCIFNFDSADSIDVWMMKDYGVKDSWTKLLTAKITQFRLRDDGILKVKPLWLFKHGEVLMDLKFHLKSLRLYDPKWDTFKYIEPIPFNYGMSDTVIYIESLVSLESGTYACQHITSSKEKMKEEVRLNNG